MKRKIISGVAVVLFSAFIVVAFLFSIGVLDVKNLTGYSVLDEDSSEISIGPITGMAALDDSDGSIGFVSIFLAVVLVGVIVFFVVKRYSMKKMLQE